MNKLSSLILTLGTLALASHTAIGKSSQAEDSWKKDQPKPNFVKDYQASIDVIACEDGEKTRDYIEGKVFLDSNYDGKLDNGEGGVAGVLVSNGYDVVQTDNKGRYKLPAKSRGLENFTVFITKPAGYRLPVDKDNVPQFSYHHIPDGSPQLRFGGLAPSGPQPKSINFPLIKDKYRHNFKIAVSGDPQPYSNNEVGFVRDSLANELAQRKDLEFVIIEGDIMGDDLGLYPRFKSIMSVADMPVYLVPGNHDLDFDATTDEHSYDTFKREWGPTYYSFDIGNVHFVVLDNVRYPCTPELDNTDGKHAFCDDPENSPTYNGVINKAQMEWLTNDLALVPKDKLVVLNMHIPLVSFVDMGSTKHQTDNTQWLYNLLEGRPAVALSGHTHTLENFLPGEFYQGWEESLGLGATPIPHIVTGATSGSWWTGDLDEYNLPMSIQRLGAPRGYLIFEFFGSKFKSQFKAANKSPKEQMSADFLSPSFLAWYNAMKDWFTTDADARPETPPVNIHDLPDTSILTQADLNGGTKLMVNVWNGSRDSKVWVKLDNRPRVALSRTQQGTGEGKNTALDPFALKKQMYVFRFAAKSESGNERTQGVELFRGSNSGVKDPQPLSMGRWTQSSSHLWEYTIPSDIEKGIHTIKIMTQDQYGKKHLSHQTFEVMDERPEPFFRREIWE